jgi:hypothetical protein
MNSYEASNGFPATRLGRGMGSLVHDATCIAQLQARLVALDLQRGSRLVRKGAVGAAIAVALLLACLPVGMLGIAELLVNVAQWQRWIAYLATSGMGLVVSLLLLWFCWKTVRQSMATFHRSREELARNVEWFKEALRPDRRRAGDW